MEDLGNVHKGSYNGKILYALRMREGMSMEELAEKIGINTACISLYENGKRMPRPRNLLKISKFFKITPLVFFTGKTNGKAGHGKVRRNNKH